MTAANVVTARQAVAANTEITVSLEAHTVNATAAVAVVVAGDVTPVTAPPVGWVAQSAAYQATADVTWVLWTNDQTLPDTEIEITVQWTGTSRAAGVTAVSSDTTGLGTVGTVQANAANDDTGNHPGLVALVDDYPLLFGGTGDVGTERYPDLTAVSLAALTDLAYSNTAQAGVDAWLLHGPAGLPAGATGAVTYDMLGQGVTAGFETITTVGFGQVSSGNADIGSPPLSLPFPGTPVVGDVAVIFATGQPPDVALSTPAVDFQAAVDSSGVTATTIGQAVPAGHAGKFAMVDLVTEGNAGTVTAPPGWFKIADIAGTGAKAWKILDGTETGSQDWTVTTARILRSQMIISDATQVGIDTIHTLAAIPHPYGPHTTPEQTGDVASLNLLSWITETAAAVPTITTDGHAITVNPLPGGHAFESAYGTWVPGLAGINPTGTATMAAVTDGVTTSWILDPRPVNPTDLNTPIATTSATAWDVQAAIPGATDTPSGYCWTKVLDADDITDAAVDIVPVAAVGEFGAVIGIYRDVDQTTPIDVAAINSGPTYTAIPTSAALPTVTDGAVEIVGVLGADHGAPGHPDSLVSAITMTVANTRQTILTPAGSVAGMYDETIPTAGPGTARTGTIVNGLTNQVNHLTIALALRPAAANGSRQTSQFVTFLEGPDLGPNITITAPPPGPCVVDPVTISGNAADSDGVAAVDLEIIRNTDGLYWNGAAFVAGPVSVAATLGTPLGVTTTWSYNAAGAFIFPGTYTVNVTGTDNAGPPVVNPAPTVRSLCVEGPTATAVLRQAKIGDGHDIVIEVVGRHGGVAPGVVIARLPVSTSAGWFTRVLDNTSESEVVARYSALDLERCCEDIAAIDDWAYELRWIWDGREQWVGPINYVEHLTDGIVIKAADLSSWWQVRVLGAHNHVAVDLATIFADYNRDAYNQEPWGMDVIPTPVGITGDREVLAPDGLVAFDALDELARTGIDYTMVGRTLLIGGEEVPIAPLVTLRDEHFTEPLRPVSNGLLRATDSVISGGVGVAGRASLPANHPHRRRYGLITNRAQERKILDAGSAQRAAQTRLDFMLDPVRVITDGTLRRDAPIDLIDLVPGARCDVQAVATCRNVAAVLRLHTIRATSAGQITLGLQPLGTVIPGT